MALGHEDDDGTFPGIIAAFMSLFGIVAAKIFIVVLVVAPAVAAMLGELEVDENFDPVEAQRETLAQIVAEEKLEKGGIDIDNATDEQWDIALAAADAEVASLSEQELQTRMQQIDQEAEQVDQAEAALAAQGAAVEDAAALEDAAPLDDAAPGFIALFFASMFSPIDGIFILLAFFTAYKVGSGQIGD